MRSIIFFRCDEKRDCMISWVWGNFKIWLFKYIEEGGKNRGRIAGRFCIENVGLGFKYK